MPAEIRVTRLKDGFVFELFTRNRLSGQDWCIGGGDRFYDTAEEAYEAGEQALIDECNREIDRI